MPKHLKSMICLKLYDIMPDNEAITPKYDIIMPVNDDITPKSGGKRPLSMENLKI